MAGGSTSDLIPAKSGDSALPRCFQGASSWRKLGIEDDRLEQEAPERGCFLTGLPYLQCPKENQLVANKRKVLFNDVLHLKEPLYSFLVLHRGEGGGHTVGQVLEVGTIREK